MVLAQLPRRLPAAAQIADRSTPPRRRRVTIGSTKMMEVVRIRAEIMMAAPAVALAEIPAVIQEAIRAVAPVGVVENLNTYCEQVSTRLEHRESMRLPVLFDFSRFD